MKHVFLLITSFYVLAVSFASDCGNVGTSEKDFFITKRNLDECLALVGRNPVDKRVAEKIWQAIKNVYSDVDGIPLHVYKNMGWTLSGISLDDIRNMTIERGELIEIFGSAESLDDDQMDIIARKVKSDWANKTPVEYSEYDLKVLGKILCYFNQSEILHIHPDAYRAAAEVIGKLNSCPHEIIEAFAKLATHRDAYGLPATWSKLDISEIGVVISGLSDTEYNSIQIENLKQNKRIYNEILSNRLPGIQQVALNGTETEQR